MKNPGALPTHPVGAGPFKLTSYVPDSHADLVRNPGYWDASQIHLANFTVQSITQPEQILAAVIGGSAGTIAAIRRGGWFDRGVTVVCSAVSTLPAFVVGIVFLGRWFDFAANRVTDSLMTLPYVFFAVAVTAALGSGLVQAMVPVGILLAPFFFRVTRAATLEHASAQYVEAAELMGASKLHVVRVHVLRKVLPTIAVTTASMTAAALLAVSFLTFLGIGVQPPAPTWGGVLSSDLAYLAQAPWAPFIPGALIAVTVGALNALADAFRDHRGAGALAQTDPIIRTHSTLEPADDDRQSQVA